jgi:ribonuclease-3
MTQLRAKIVSRQSLNDIARRIGLDKYVVYNSGGNFTQKHIYGDAFEAMMGAIYLDQGYEFVNRLLINNIFYKYLSIDALTESETDFKSRLIEWCQKNRHTVVFRTRSDAHAPHTSPTFYSTVLIDGIEVGHGAGDSKKAAEQNAAASLSHEISDEECAELLDRLDKISPAPEIKSVKSAQPSEVVPSTEVQGESAAKAKRGRRPKKTAATEEGQSGNPEMKVEKSEQSLEVEVVADSVEQPKKSKRPRRTKRSVTANDAEMVGVEVPEKADKSHEKADKPKRRRRTSKPKDEASSVTAQQESTSEN